MADGSNVGTGKTSPFGNGAGQAGGSKVAKVNDFQANPGGTRARTSIPDPYPQPQAQSPREGVADRSKADAAPGELVYKADAPAGGAAGSPIGVGSIGNSQKSFKLNGGG